MRRLRARAYDFLRAAPFFLVHLATIAVFWTSVHSVDWIMCGALYVIRMFGITAGYHRYFSHRSYKTSRPFQFVLAWLGCSALQKGPLWWASHHRVHHKHSDMVEDPHSPVIYTLFKAHLGWIFEKKNDLTHYHLIRDFTKYPELMWLNRWHWIPGICLATACFGISWLVTGSGWGGLVAFFISTVLLYHGTFTINSLSHIWGSRRYSTTDDSRNNMALAVITLGEGWHNNHHHYPASARQGFYWWEIDLTYWGLRMLAALGLVRDLKPVPTAVRDRR
jgi:stearoyl-CoA desaturase (delta-9 desaturase)